MVKGQKTAKAGIKRQATTSTAALALAEKSVAGPKKPKKGSGIPVATCCGCGTIVTELVKAVQCEKCGDHDAWKCIGCLKIEPETYELLTTEAASSFHWFCDRCEHDVLSGGDESDERTEAEPAGKLDAIMGMLSQVLEKSNAFEQQLNKKADCATVAKLEARVRKMEEKLAEKEGLLTKLEARLERENKEGSGKSEADKVAPETIAKVVQEVVTKQREAEKEKDSRKLNIILYRAEEVDSEVAQDRKDGDQSFVRKLCNDILGVKVEDSDITRLFRLGKRGDNAKPRPLLFGMKSAEKKSEIMSSLKKLSSAEDRYRCVGVAHDLTPQQREAVKSVLEEARVGSMDDEESKNWKLVVRGQTSAKPRVLRVRRN